MSQDETRRDTQSVQMRALSNRRLFFLSVSLSKILSSACECVCALMDSSCYKEIHFRFSFSPVHRTGLLFNVNIAAIEQFNIACRRYSLTRSDVYSESIHHHHRCCCCSQVCFRHESCSFSGHMSDDHYLKFPDGMTSSVRIQSMERDPCVYVY